MLKNVCFACILIFCAANATSQPLDTAMYVFKKAEQELQQLQQVTFKSRSQKERVAGNKEFLAAWDRIVHLPKILDYPFDSLKDVSVLRAPDGKFKLITWNLHMDDGTHAYFGYLLVNNSRRVKRGFLRYETEEAYEYFKLLDKSVTVKSPESYVGTPDKWFGMLYTQVIACDGFYTLIGWDGNDKLSQRKFIDVLHFKPDGTPVFGKDVFRIPHKNPRRMMFEYSSEIVMSVKYNEKRKQIIYSHLAARQEGLLTGLYQYYGPDGSFDALELKKDKWVSIEDVDAKRERSKNDSEYNDPRNPQKHKGSKMLPKGKGAKR